MCRLSSTSTAWTPERRCARLKVYIHRRVRLNRTETTQTYSGCLLSCETMQVCPIKHYLKYYGPGIWFSMHCLAYNCDLGQVDPIVFVQYVSMMRVWLPCSKCRSHFQKYVRSHPIRSTDMFKWSVDFHNAVNRKLRRPEYSYSHALEMMHAIQSGCKS